MLQPPAGRKIRTLEFSNTLAASAATPRPSNHYRPNLFFYDTLRLLPLPPGLSTTQQQQRYHPASLATSMPFRQQMRYHAASMATSKPFNHYLRNFTSVYPSGTTQRFRHYTKKRCATMRHHRPHPDHVTRTTGLTTTTPAPLLSRHA
jgi:hypothetical protein